MSPTVLGDALEALTYRKVTRRLVPLLFFCYVVAYLDRVNVGFAKLQMQQDLGFTDTVYGLGAGIFFLGYFIFEIPSNIFLLKTGARRWIARIMVSWGLISSVMMLVRTPTSFYVMRFLLGIAEAGFFPGIILYLTFWYPEARRGHIMAMFMTAIAFSGIVGGPVSGWILQNLGGVNGWAGWKWLFLLEGLPSIFAGCLVWCYLDDSIGSAKWLSTGEKRILLENIANDETGRMTTPIWRALADRRILLFAAIYFLLIMGLYGIGFWLPQLIKNTGVDTLWEVGLLSSIPYGASAGAMILLGRHSDRTGERRWHVAGSALLGGAGLLFSTYFDSQTLAALTALTLATTGVLAALPIFWTLPTGVHRGAAAAAGIGLINSCGNLAGFVSPSLIGYLQDLTGSTKWGLCVIAASLFLAACLVVQAVRATPGTN